MSNYASKVQKLRETIAQQQSKINELNQSVATMNQNVKDWSKKYYEVAGQAEDSEIEIERLKDDNRILTEENEALKKQISEIEKNLPKKAPSSLGVATVSTEDRLDMSKLPPKPEKAEFDTDYSIYTDGACLGNGRPGLGYGGWGAIVQNNATMEMKTLSGAAGPETTNQVMELTGVLNAIEEAVCEIPENASVTLCTDSNYAVKGITEWSTGWQKNGWLNSSGNPVANRELWEKLLEMVEISGLNIEFKWVKGHNGHFYNELCDILATSAAAKRAKECGCSAFDEQLPTY